MFKTIFLKPVLLKMSMYLHTLESECHDYTKYNLLKTSSQRSWQVDVPVQRSFIILFMPGLIKLSPSPLSSKHFSHRQIRITKKSPNKSDTDVILQISFKSKL